MKELPKNVSESVRKRNPELYGPDLGRLANPKRQQSQRSQSQDRVVESGQTSMAYRVFIVSIRKKLVDEHDNLRTGAKPLVDTISATLGFDDADPRISWEYGQIKTTGKPGTIIKIERIS